MLPFWQTRPFSCRLNKVRGEFQGRIPDGGGGFWRHCWWFVVMLPQGRDFQAVKLEIGGPESMTAF